MTVPHFHTRLSLGQDLRELGLRPGDMVMVHAAMSRVGLLLSGPDVLIDALRDAVGPSGTIVAYTDWNGAYDELLDGDGRVPEEWRPHIAPFDPALSRAIRDNGVFPEFLRTTPGARRSGNPGASVAAVGAGADWLTADHPLDYGYGEGSPLAKLVKAGGKVLMVGAPLDTMTLLHHAEHLAQIPGKRLRRYEVPFATPAGTVWRMLEEFDTADPVVAGLESDYFAASSPNSWPAGMGRKGRSAKRHRCWSMRLRSAASLSPGWSSMFGPSAEQPAFRGRRRSLPPRLLSSRNKFPMAMLVWR
ncbi:UNVERIFIED_ORG: aminoglycoside 3-N-acetyltransferase [Rhizobium esperanzae]